MILDDVAAIAAPEDPVAAAVAALAEAAFGSAEAYSPADLGAMVESYAALRASGAACSEALQEAGVAVVGSGGMLYDARGADRDLALLRGYLASPPPSAASRKAVLLHANSLIRHDMVMLGMAIKKTNTWLRFLPVLVVTIAFSGIAGAIIGYELFAHEALVHVVAFLGGATIGLGAGTAFRKSYDWFPPKGAVEAAQRELAGHGKATLSPVAKRIRAHLEELIALQKQLAAKFRA